MVLVHGEWEFYDPQVHASAECLVVQLDSHAAGELSSVERGAG